jgi:hypothetical protein
MSDAINRPVKSDGNVQDSFQSGAVRDTQKGKPRYDLISPFFLKRLAVLMAKGAEHYGDRNWEKGIPSSRCVASLDRHINQWKMGDTDEDHLIQAAFNIMAIVHNEEYNHEFHDMPIYNKQPLYIAGSGAMPDFGMFLQSGNDIDDTLKRSKDASDKTTVQHYQV